MEKAVQIYVYLVKCHIRIRMKSNIKQCMYFFVLFCVLKMKIIGHQLYHQLFIKLSKKNNNQQIKIVSCHLFRSRCKLSRNKSDPIRIYRINCVLFKECKKFSHSVDFFVEFWPLAYNSNSIKR